MAMLDTGTGLLEAAKRGSAELALNASTVLIKRLSLRRAFPVSPVVNLFDARFLLSMLTTLVEQLTTAAARSTTKIFI